MKRPRMQCQTCPWRADVDPRNIPGGYGHVIAELLAEHTPSGPASLASTLHIATCHEKPERAKLPCVGWLVHQLGAGNNLALRLRVIHGCIDGNVRTVGPQRDLCRELLPVSVSGGSTR